MNHSALPRNDEPWVPFFRTREDFEFGDIALQAALKKEHRKALIQLINKCLRGEGKFTLTDDDDLQGSWERAERSLTPVCYSCVSFSILYDLSPLIFL